MSRAFLQYCPTQTADRLSYPGRPISIVEDTELINLFKQVFSELSIGVRYIHIAYAGYAQGTPVVFPLKDRLSNPSLGGPIRRFTLPQMGETLPTRAVISLSQGRAGPVRSSRLPLARIHVTLVLLSMLNGQLEQAQSGAFPPRLRTLWKAWNIRRELRQQRRSHP